jgi:hypothetical protein
MNHKKIYEKLNSGKETRYGNKNVVMGGYTDQDFWVGIKKIIIFASNFKEK